MYRGGKICLTDHFKPLWGRNAPKFGQWWLVACLAWVHLSFVLTSIGQVSRTPWPWASGPGWLWRYPTS